jgi:hypothetical protein
MTLVRDGDLRGLCARVSAAVGAGDGDRVDAAAAGAGTFAAQVDVVRIDDLPVGRRVAVAEAVDRFVAGDGSD